MLRAINHMLDTVTLSSYFYFYYYSFQADILLKPPTIQPTPAPRRASSLLSPFKSFKKTSSLAELRADVPGVQRLPTPPSDSA